MTTPRRWAVLGVAMLLALGAAVAWQARPVPESGIGAVALLERVRAAEHPYSGYVEAQGSLALPAADAFDDVGDLLGGRSRLRVWHVAEDRWRVATLTTSGETDLVHSGGSTTSWSYERARATRSPDPEVRLPRADDLLPPELGSLVVQGVRGQEVRRLPAARVAGVVAPGLRITPSSPAASVSRVDLWADPGTGLPLRVEVYGPRRVAAVTSRFLEFSTTVPTPEQVSFTPPPGAELRTEDVLDIADAANRFGGVSPPLRLAGISRRPSPTGAVGVYGVGVTRLIAIPLWDQVADPVRDQLRRTPGGRSGPLGLAAEIGPMSLLVTGTDVEAGWLVAGTATPATLRRAARDLAGLGAES